MPGWQAQCRYRGLDRDQPPVDTVRNPRALRRVFFASIRHCAFPFGPVRLKNYSGDSDELSNHCDRSRRLFPCRLNQPRLGPDRRAANAWIPGYLDARGGFHVYPPALEENAEPDAVTTFAGTIVVNFTITVTSTIPTTDKISCLVNATVFDTASTNSILETAAVAATRSGSSATGKVSIPYSWALSSATSDQVQLSYEISAPGLLTASNGLPLRTSTQNFAHIAVPKTGTTTTETVVATI